MSVASPPVGGGPLPTGSNVVSLFTAGRSRVGENRLPPSGPEICNSIQAMFDELSKNSPRELRPKVREDVVGGRPIPQVPETDFIVSVSGDGFGGPQSETVRLTVPQWSDAAQTKTAFLAAVTTVLGKVSETLAAELAAARGEE